MHAKRRANTFYIKDNHPIASLCSLSTLNSFSSSFSVKDAEIITGSVEDSPKYTYLKCAESCFSSKVGGFSIDVIELGKELFPRSSKY